ncbi:DUF6993 domain-containing protein [Leucobacter sp. M11]|uniref:DUF6993 domain-containing protein n=1 Tax=Leucobacter sp. M11 TaxID=2993565 RepID=UPI002D7E3106|nr:hypothetical protein [Leucobacter sp. M11]MEB4616600.1 hypothetical protein [Leucobacter sp. M11]
MRTQRFLGSALVLGLALTLTACVPPPAERPKPTKDPAAPDPVLVAGGSAEENLPFFEFTLDRVGENDDITGQFTVNTLVDAGFDKAAMQVSFDETKTNLKADNIFVSVRVGQECLLGQVVTETGEVAATVEPVVGPEANLCLIGKTRAIDW